MKAVVLAGGRGRRLRPLTFERPAALLPVANRPVVEYLLDHFARHGVDEATLILHHCPYPVERRLGDGTRWGLRLDYALERIPLGTAGGLRLVAGGWSEPFIVAAGTALTTSDLAKAAAFHRDREAALTMVVAAAPDGPVDVRLDEEGSLEVGAQGGRGFVSLGLAIVSPDAVALVPPRRRFDVLADLVPRLRAAGLPVWGYVSSEPGLVVRTPRELLVANRRALAGELPDLVLPGFEIAPRIRLCRGARVHPTAHLSPPVLIGVNAVVGRDAVVEAAVIGDDVIVEPGSTVRGSVVLPRTHLGPGLEVREAIVNRSTLGDVSAGTWVDVEDPQILGDTRAPFRTSPGSLVGRAAAAALLVATAPVWLPCFLAVVIEGRGRPFRSRLIVGARGHPVPLHRVALRGPVGRLLRCL
ncbi:MAG: hypothetical protein DMD79_25760, partial [Candidatus Rokuibacteriota bacterium]